MVGSLSQNFDLRDVPGEEKETDLNDSAYRFI